MFERKIQKYYMTDLGKEKLAENQRAYRMPSLEGKIMKLLGSGVGYRTDSIVSQVMTDKRMCCNNEGVVVAELIRLAQLGYIKVGD